MYLDPDGERIEEPEVLRRIAELVIPPAWQDVWVCPYPGGHIQATGIDERGRKQYLYHRRWRERQDQKKFDDMVGFARALPALRRRAGRDIARGDLSREHVLAGAVRLLDIGFFRIGSEDYAVTNETYGLATMKKRHVRIADHVVSFDYPAKHSKRHVRHIVDDELASLVTRLKSRRGGIDELLAYKERGRWRDVRSADINAYLKEATRLDASAKDFRTWGATVHAAVALAATNPEGMSPTRRKRLITHAVKQVAEMLGQHPGGRPRLLHRPARLRPLQRRRGDQGGPDRPRRGHRAPGRRGGGRPRPHHRRDGQALAAAREARRLTASANRAAAPSEQARKSEGSVSSSSRTTGPRGVGSRSTRA